MSETVRRRRFLERACEFERLADFPPPHIGDGFKPIGLTHDKGTETAPLRARSKTVAHPIGDVSEHLSAILLCPEKNFVTRKAAHMKQTNIRNPQTGMDHD